MQLFNFDSLIAGAAQMLPDMWGAPQWLVPASIMLIIGIALLVWSYMRSESPTWVKVTSMLLKTVGLLLLVAILLEPKTKLSRPERGANTFVVLADQSQSLSIRDPSQRETRGERLARILDAESDWLNVLSDQFDVRRYTFDSRLHAVNDFSQLDSVEVGSNIVGSLAMLSGRLNDKPTGGILLFTDGNATDLHNDKIDWSKLPPIYPVVIGSLNTARDIAITRVSVSQTNFETAPVTVTVELDAQGYAGKTVDVQLLDDQSKEIQRKTVTDVEDNKKFAVRFAVKPVGRGVHFYRVRAFEKSHIDQFENESSSREATLVNNVRRLAVDRGQGPYRILYVSGRPNWEFKFLNRALAADPEVELAALIRVANKEPKFSFRGHRGESTNPLFRGFGNKDDQTAEQYDEPVLIRINVKDKEELRDGFPKEAEELYKFDALIFDDLEAAFFDQDQMSLIQQFVSIRGGTLLMLGGRESFVRGNFDRTPIGELLPVYLDPFTKAPTQKNYQLLLTREGWLQPWVRVRSTEDEEKTRLAKMPRFQTINRIRSIKPGATVLARVKSPGGQTHPALVVQKFGKGHSAALLIGDLWRWQMEDGESDDLGKSWRQTARWLVSNVPRPVKCEVNPGRKSGSVDLAIRVNNASFDAMDNASIKVSFSPPGTQQDDRKKQPKIELTAVADNDEPGLYRATIVSHETGNYRADIHVTAPDGSDVGKIQTGWVSQPNTNELRQLKPNRTFLESIAEKTGGRIVKTSELKQFAKMTPTNEKMITEVEIQPWWHRWQLFAIVIGLFVTEWGIRRWKGLP